MRALATILVFFCAMRIQAVEPVIRTEFEGNDPTRIVISCRLEGTVGEKLAPGPIAEAVAQPYLSLAIVDEQTRSSGPAIFGKYEVADGRLLFRPAFNLVRGVTYRIFAVYDRKAVQPFSIIEYRVPPAEATTPTVVQTITPSGDALPANVLRFYVTFSRPMREGREVLERIKLYDAAGSEIVSPWRDIELWNADATRLSLFLHPGRIKQGVNLREQLGPILLPGRKYAIVFDADLRDAAGSALGREFRHEFSTTAEVRTRIDVAAWKIAAPAAGTREPLRIEFDRALDAALALRLVKIRDAAGNEVPGESESADGERTRRFTPAAAWRTERYAVEADPTLEDEAGNTPVRVFDTDLSEPTVEVLPPQLRREFTPR